MGLIGRGPRSDKIFISYRRDDAGGFAGRLSDTLTAHFGGERVFRDITGIDYGADFERVIDARLGESSAVIVLIGDRWASATDAAGARRLDDPGDYVRREVSAALASGAAVVPVLIGEAGMPRREELPDGLESLARRNAMSLTDERWDYDVARLAKMLAIDVPGSVAQRRLDLLRAGALALIVAAGLFGVLTFCRALGQGALAGIGLIEAGYPPIVSGIPFIAILIAGALILSAAPLMERERRGFAWAAVALAAGGTLATFVYYALHNVEQPTWSLAVNFGASGAILIGMAALIALAGFRAR